MADPRTVLRRPLRCRTGSDRPADQARTAQPGAPAIMSSSSSPTATIFVRAYVGLGANLSNAAATVRQAAAELRCVPGLSSLRLFPLYGTAWLDSSGPD